MGGLRIWFAASKAGMAAIAKPETVNRMRMALAPMNLRKRDFGGGGGVLSV